MISAMAAALLLAACASDELRPRRCERQRRQRHHQRHHADVTPGSPQDFQQNVGDRVFFDTDRYDLSAEAQSQLQKQAAWLAQYPSVTVTVEGHADERGTREYNLGAG
jgi:peptidoglycan-associated lipoprotein